VTTNDATTPAAAGHGITPDRRPVPLLSPADVAEYRRTGYFVIRNVLSAAEIQDIRGGCDELQTIGRAFDRDSFSGYAFFNVFRDANPFAKNIESVATVPGKIRRVTYPYAVSQVLNRYRTHEKLLGCVTPVLGPDVNQIVNQVNFHFPKSTAGWGWHQDYRFRKAGIPDMVQNFVQTIIAIDPCNNSTGGLRVVPGSHNLGDLKLDVDNERAETFFDATTAVTPVLAPGDVIIFNSHVIHGSQANVSDQIRRVYINGFAVGSALTGVPVVRSGRIIPDIAGKMEYEDDRETLPKASKY
jgi:ectoine hydroxylase-related dioxygenase (phytanoyl-CoA dioxygenase family)